MLRKVDYLKGYFEDDKYWPQPPCPNTDENRGKLVKELDIFHYTIDNLDPCFKVEPEVNLDSVKRIIDNAILDLNSLAVLGLASKKKSIYDHTLKIMYSLVNAHPVGLYAPEVARNQKREAMRKARGPTRAVKGT
ncbi:Uncharacterized protein FWK35_00039079 [Aphis craccivora]|uniref:Uncharacterized protein n=1 Tax=Aphis craccivora TaxID=307492 RepID=A0A6G0VKL6_APHCR|nr:Uncharacterized protein FWK35_00039079 [Aphis craccivora]